MTKWMQKHGKEVLVAAIVLVACCIVAVIYQYRTATATKSIENEIPNESRSSEVYTDTFYSNQLTDLELENFNLLEERMQAKEGGIVEFTEALTGEEYLRITAAVSYQSGNYYYGLIDIPMTKANVCVSYNNEDLTEVTDSIITKAILFISAAEGINEQGKYEDDGTVTNLDEIADGLTVNDEAKLAKIDEELEKTDSIIDGVISEIPAEYGEKETVDYFLKWMDENLTYNNDLNSQVSSFKTMEEIFEGAYVNVNTACVVDGNATALGYVKLLTEFCNRAGIRSHIVMGAWGNSGQTAYALSAIEFDGQTIYVDASGYKGSDLSGQKYITEETARKKMLFTTYFDYTEKE